MSTLIGVVPGSTPASPSSVTPLGSALRVLDAAIARFSLPIETRTLEPASARYSPELSGCLFGTGVDPSRWLRDLGGPLTLASPFFVGTAARSALVLWPAEDVVRVPAQMGGPDAGWLETNHLSSGAVDAAWRAARDLARERGDLPVTWAFAGWGETEPQVVRRIQNLAAHEPMQVLGLEQVPDTLRTATYASGGAIVLTLARTALTFARFLGAQGWVAWKERGAVLAQPAGGPDSSSIAQSSALSVALLLDRLGYPREASLIESIVAVERRAPSLNVERIVARLSEAG